MDKNIYANSRISRLPKALQPPAVLLRNLLPNSPEPYVYQADGMATHHYSPFLSDDEFNARYAKVADRWTGEFLDIRWRVWMQVQCVRHVRPLTGSFAEFGVYRGSCSYMMLSFGQLPRDRSYFLFDTFEGIPASDLTSTEAEAGLAGRLSNTSVDEVAALLSEWKEQLQFVPGNVLETLDVTETGPLVFAHIDLNAAAPTTAATDYAYSRMVTGGILLFDDYGSAEYVVQRDAIDAFFAGKREQVFALPTGQGMAIKL